MSRIAAICVIWILCVGYVQAQGSFFPGSGVQLSQEYDIDELKSSLVLALQKAQIPWTGDLQLSYQSESPGAHHYTFRQVYMGYPIYQADLQVHVDKSYKIRAIVPQLFKFPVQEIPSYDSRAENFFPGLAETYGAKSFQAESILFWNQGQLIPAYRISCSSLQAPYSFEVLLHAQSGEQLRFTSLDLNSHAHFQSDTTGRGRVFSPNPCTKANVRYGDLFIDSMDYHKEVFETLMDTVILLDICYEEDSFRLKGPYVEITELAPPYVPATTSGDGSFFFRRDESGFEDVMAYYHIDRMQRWIQSKGYTNLFEGPLAVDAHAGEGEISVTSIVDSLPQIKFGLGGVDDAEDADVIIHEYGHAISYYASRTLARQHDIERLGVDEGICDFFAAIYSQDMGFENWDLLFNWDGHNEFWPGRTATSSRTYPLEGRDTSDVYLYGEVWASLLLSLRETLGKEVLDLLVLEELYLNHGSVDLPTAAQLLLLSDSLLFEGIHTEELNFAFCKKGLIPNLKQDCSVVSISEPYGQESILLVSPNPVKDILQLNFKHSHSSQPEITVRLFDATGKQCYDQGLTPNQKLLDLTSLPAGVYLLQIQGEDRILGHQKIMKLP